MNEINKDISPAEIPITNNADNDIQLMILQGGAIRLMSIAELSKLVISRNIRNTDANYGIDANDTWKYGYGITNVNTPDNKWFHIVSFSYYNGSAVTQIALPYYETEKPHYRTGSGIENEWSRWKSFAE